MGRKRLSARVRSNRLNAKKSTGPKTPSGRKRSAGNSLLHGFSVEQSDYPSHPETEIFIDWLCDGDKSPNLTQAARELSDAQFWLNSIRHYKMILQILKSKNQSSPLPPSEYLNDQYMIEILEYVSTGEPSEWGPRKKGDYRFKRRIENFIFKQARRQKDPDLERKRLYRYEKLAHKRRLDAIEKFDSIRTYKGLTSVQR